MHIRTRIIPPNRQPISSMLWITLFFFLALAPLSWADELSVSASLSPKSFSVDEGARLTITVSGSRSADLELPQTDPSAYEIFQRGRSSQVNIVNGDITAAITFTCIIRGYTPGKYTLPPMSVSADGETRTTDPIDFTITGAPQQQGGSGAGSGQQPSTSTGKDSQDVAFLTLELERDKGYVGEIMPVRVKAYFRKGLRASLNAAPTLVGDGLIMPQLTSKPVQTDEIVGNTRYSVLTWDTALSNIKEGAHAVQLELDATLLIPERRSSHSLFGQSPFGDDDFFNNFFGGYREKPITARSKSLQFTSLPLPDEGRPHGFTGAIGDFNLQVNVAPAEAEVGEPMTLTMTVSGTGNFDRVQAPPFPHSKAWKTYNPTSEFTPLDDTHQTGKKVFEQAIVAREALSEIPPLAFSYFDPIQERYITRQSVAIPVTIDTPVQSAPVTPPVSTVEVGTSPPVPDEQATLEPAFPGLAPIHIEAGQPVKRIRPPYAKPLVLLLAGLIITALLVLAALHLKQRHRLAHPEQELARQRTRDLQSSLSSLQEVQESGESTLFLATCRTTIQNHLATAWHARAEAITRADLIARLGNDHPLVTIFAVAEESAYSGAQLDTKKMEEYTEIITTELEKL